MTPKELKKLIKDCRELGVTHYKCGDIEFNLTPDTPKPVEKKLTKKEEKELKEKVSSIATTFELSDIELAERLFPDDPGEVQ